MNVKICRAELKATIGVTSKIPDLGLCEFAFAGKSNVGKSSLINTIMQRKSLARTSATPGKTQTINYYDVEEDLSGKRRKLLLVDLPGYGYTKASPGSRESWGKMVEKYLKLSLRLKGIFLLLDIRHAPGENDVQMFEWIRQMGYRPVIIATKLDKLKKNEIPAAVKTIREKLGLAEGEVLIPFSSETKAGLETVYSILNDLYTEASHDQDHNA